MKLALKLAAGCAILIAAPASAQILGGGGGLGGTLGGGGGQLGGNLGGSIGRTTGNLGGAGDIGVERNIDRQQRRAGVRTRGNAQGNGSLDTLGRSVNGGGAASADVGADTDQVRNTVGNVRDRAGTAVANTRDRAAMAADNARTRAGNAVNSVRDTAGSASLSGSAAASANANGKAGAQANGNGQGNARSRNASSRGEATPRSTRERSNNRPID